MTHTAPPFLLILAAAILFTPALDVAAQVIDVTRVATGLSRPVYVTAAPGDNSHLFILEQHTGRIRTLDRDNGVLLPTPFLNLPDSGTSMSTENEQGLLGMAFHPDYQSNGLFYINFTAPGVEGGTTHIREYQVSGDPLQADMSTARTILTFSQPANNHNGGWIGFGPHDDLLYIASGDGGDGHDNGTGHTPGIGNAQDTTDNLLGKMLRIDVDGDDFGADPNRNYAIPEDNPFVNATGDDEIWSYGLRNPWRSSFDRLTADLFIADVGQRTREEIDVQLAASNGGENYGWRLREGTIATPTGGVGGPAPAGEIDPIYDYEHGIGPTEGFAVVGGYVYRGPHPDLQGQYFFADNVIDNLWSIEFDGSDPTTHDGTNFSNLRHWTDGNLAAEFVPDVGDIDNIGSFGEDNAGNLFIVDLTDGDVFMVVPEPTVSPVLVALAVLFRASNPCRRRAHSI